MKTKRLMPAWLYGFLLLAAVALAGCGNKDKNSGSVTEQENASAEASNQTDPPIVQAPDFSLQDSEGKTFSLKTLQGKVVFINFWATWCPPCLEELPSISRLKASLKDKSVEFLMVDVDNNLENSAAFMKRKDYDLPVFGSTADIPPDYLGSSIPTTVIIDKSGNIVARFEGGRDYMSIDMTRFMNALIEDK